MNVHPQLQNALLVGVERTPLGNGLGASAELNTLLEAIPGEHLLWHALAANDLWQRAGFTPTALPLAGVAASADSARCPFSAERALQMILRGIHPELLETWLALAAAAHVPLPHTCIVPLLEMGMQKPALRQALVPLLGERGTWLAAQNSTWAQRYGVTEAAGQSADTMWQLGSIEQRCSALEAMRRLDPAGALAALELEWKNEPPEHRIMLLPRLATGLSLADEAFLERALDDKRKEVRTAAQNMLASLPGSALVARNTARLTALLTLERKSGFAARIGAMLGGLDATLKVQLPEPASKEMKRDGIGTQSSHGLGEKANMLLDMMSCVPPTHWSTTWNMTPEQVVGVFSVNEFTEALLKGLARAATRAVQSTSDDAAFAWFVAMFEVDNHVRGIGLTNLLLPEIDHLPLARQEQLMQRWLEQTPYPAFHQVSHLIEQCAARNQRPLSNALSRLALAQAQRAMLDSGASQYYPRSVFTVMRLALDATDLGYLDANWPADSWEHWPRWQAAVDEFKETMQFRHTMQRSFLENDA
jgi:hypothetical protein